VHLKSGQIDVSSRNANKKKTKKRKDERKIGWIKAKIKGEKSRSLAVFEWLAETKMGTAQKWIWRAEGTDEVPHKDLGPSKNGGGKASGKIRQTKVIGGQQKGIVGDFARISAKLQERRT